MRIGPIGQASLQSVRQHELARPDDKVCAVPKYPQCCHDFQPSATIYAFSGASSRTIVGKILE